MKTQHTVTIDGKVEKRVKLIEEYWNTLDPKPDMTFKQFETVCKAPFLHMRRKISEEKLYDIRFKYLGSFIPTPKQVVRVLFRLKERHKKQYITHNMYQRRTEAILDYIKKNPEPFKRFKELLKHDIKI